MSTQPTPQPDPIVQMVQDPDFAKLPLSEQRKALSAHDPMFQQAGDGAIGQFVQAHQAPQAAPNSFLGGIGRRLMSMLPDQGPTSTLDSILGAMPGLGQAAGLVQAEKQLGPQLSQQMSAAAASHRGDKSALSMMMPNLQDARAATTGASMLDPFAAGSVANINQLQSEGRGREAAGQGLTDAALLGAGGVAGRVVPKVAAKLDDYTPSGNIPKLLGREVTGRVPVLSRFDAFRKPTFSEYADALRPDPQLDLFRKTPKLGGSPLSAPESAPPAPVSTDQLLQNVKDAIDKRFGKQDWDTNAPKPAETQNILDLLSKSILQAKKPKLTK